MFARISRWCKGIVSTLLMLAFVAIATAQDESTLPELDINTGLQSNAVRCIKISSQGRTWVGTDNGLNILNPTKTLQSNVIDVLGHTSIWSIDFLDSLVFIGTRNEGLYIFNQTSGHLHKHYPNSIINLIRKIKVFDHQVFILSNNGVYLLYDGVFKKIPIGNGPNDDFLLDMFQWNNGLYGLRYPNHKVVELLGRKFSETLQDNLSQTFQDNLVSPYGYYTAFSNNNKLVLGGSGNIKSVIVIEKNKPQKNKDLSDILLNQFVIWDIVFLPNKIVLAIGDTRSNSKGMLYVINEDYSCTMVDVIDYVTCLALNGKERSIYYGTLNKGLFLKRIRDGSEFAEKPSESQICISDKFTFSYTDHHIQNLKEQKRHRAIDSCSAINISGDTLVVADNKNVQVYDANTLHSLASFSFPDLINFVSKIERINETMFTFNIYARIKVFDIRKGYLSNFDEVETTIPYPKKFGDKIILLNKEKGFCVITEKTSYPLTCDDAGVAFVNDFTLIGNRLYTLSFNDFKTYEIDYHSKRLILIKTVQIRNLVEGFMPKWVLSNGENLYLANEQGILKCMKESLSPKGYYYWGNYNKMDRPIVISDSLVIVSKSIIHKIAFDEIDRMEHAIEKQFPTTLRYPESINENLGFKMHVSQPEYLLQNHSLKTLEIWKRGELVMTKYTVSPVFSFDDGLTYGSYDIVLQVGSERISYDMSITLPLSRNPYFFSAIGFLLLLIIGIAVKSNLDKRLLNKKLLQNRMQIMKQNLNPHFVYNSMNMISSLILEGRSDEAVQVVSDFSQLQRSYLETNNKSQISLSEELEFLNAYLNLQKKRFYEDNNFEYEIDVLSRIDIKSIMIPPLILQPIAENFVKYGVIASKALSKTIRIEVVDRGQIIVAIEDNGIDVDTSSHSLQLGHKLVKERIEIYNATYRTNIQIAFGKPPIYGSTGYRVELSIPVT